MAKKLRYGLTVKAIKGTPPKWLSTATAIVGILLVAKHQLIGDLPGAADTTKELASAWYDYIMSITQVLLSVLVIFTGYDDDDKPDTDYPGFSSRNGINTILLLVGLSVLLSSCSRKTLDISHSSHTTDSTWTTSQLVQVPVKGGSTRDVNMDSLKKLLDAYMSRYRNNPELPSAGNMVPPEIINQVYTIPDTSGRYELQYWMSATGELMARCMAKDTTIEALVEQNNRLIRKTEATATTKTIYKTPGWVKGMIAGIVMLIIVGIIILLLKGKGKAISIIRDRISS